MQARQLTYAIIGCPLNVSLAASRHSFEFSDTDVMTHSVMKKMVYTTKFSRDRFFISWVIPLFSILTTVEQMVMRIHLITKMASMDSHNPGQSLITKVDWAPCSTMPTAMKSDILSMKMKICTRM